MSVKMGNLFVIQAQKAHPCHLGGHCREGGYIQEGDTYLELIHNRIMPVGGMVNPERSPDVADRGEDGSEPKSPKRKYQLKQKFIVTRYHHRCLGIYTEKVGIIKPFVEDKKGRPTDERLKLLPAELKEMRRKWQKERSRMIHLAMVARDPLEELQYCLKATALRIQIANTGVPLQSQYYPAGFPELQNRHICSATTAPQLHQLGEDYHCTNCGKCYGRQHVHA